MKNKYYTPELDEFYIGFEYEYCIRNNEYIKYIVSTETDLKHIHKQIQLYLIRVKYLDREDIESLGWEFEENLQYCDQFKYKSLEAYLWVIKDENLIEIQCEKTCFRGCIQNKSELKKLMKQIGIK